MNTVQVELAQGVLNNFTRKPSPYRVTQEGVSAPIQRFEPENPTATDRMVTVSCMDWPCTVASHSVRGYRQLNNARFDTLGGPFTHDTRALKGTPCCVRKVEHSPAGVCYRQVGSCCAPGLHC